MKAGQAILPGNAQYSLLGYWENPGIARFESLRGEFTGGLAVRTPGFHNAGWDSVPSQETEIPQAAGWGWGGTEGDKCSGKVYRHPFNKCCFKLGAGTPHTYSSYKKENISTPFYRLGN